MKKTVSNNGVVVGRLRIVVAGAESGNTSSSITVTTTLLLFTKSTDSASNVLWGITPTAAQVKATNFGFSVSDFAQQDIYTDTIGVDYGEMKVSWVAP